MTDRVAEPATHSPARAAATADVVIVNWNAGDLLRRCVESVRDHQAGHVSKVVVVDNGSVDGSDLGPALCVGILPARFSVSFVE